MEIGFYELKQLIKSVCPHLFSIKLFNSKYGEYWQITLVTSAISKHELELLEQKGLKIISIGSKQTGTVYINFNIQNEAKQ